jgi:hypothetical protein
MWQIPRSRLATNAAILRHTAPSAPCRLLPGPSCGGLLRGGKSGPLPLYLSLLSFLRCALLSRFACRASSRARFSAAAFWSSESG